jgi:hypothetical protein
MRSMCSTRAYARPHDYSRPRQPKDRRSCQWAAAPASGVGTVAQRSRSAFAAQRMNGPLGRARERFARIGGPCTLSAGAIRATFVADSDAEAERMRARTNPLRQSASLQGSRHASRSPRRRFRSAWISGTLVVGSPNTARNIPRAPSAIGILFVLLASDHTTTNSRCNHRIEPIRDHARAHGRCRCHLIASPSTAAF